MGWMTEEDARELSSFVESLGTELRAPLWQSNYGFKVGLEDEYGSLLEGVESPFALARQCSRMVRLYRIQLDERASPEVPANGRLDRQMQTRLSALSRLREALLSRYVD